jgi:hypothetical protein
MMIKNEQQYELTKSSAEGFVKTLQAIREGQGDIKDLHPLLRKAHEDAYTSLLEDLRDDIHEYEALKRGEFPLEELRKVSELPKILIKARIAQGISPKELADRLDLDEQDIQQYEANDYASATLGRISDVAMVLMIYSRTDLTT